jgi:signal transduction histidine kinase/HAMP domain-containing protein
MVPLSIIDGEIREAILPVLYSLTLALILVILFTFAGLVITVIKPLTHLNNVALEITHTGELDRQVNIRSDDEIGNLANSFNRMIKSLKEKEIAVKMSQTELEKHKDHLEELVQERTKELSVAISELAVLNQIRRDIISIIELDELLPTIVQRIMDTLSADRCTLFLYDDINVVLRVRAVKGYKSERLVNFSYRPGEEIVGIAFTTGQIQYVPDLEKSLDIPRRDEIRSVLAIPLASSKSSIQGVISVASLKSNAFRPNQQQLLETIAGQIARTIENARLYKSTEENAVNLAKLYQVGKNISSTLELDIILQSIVNEAQKLVQANKSIILLVDNDNYKVKAVGYGYTADQLQSHSYQEIKEGISGWVLNKMKPTLSPDIQSDKRNKGIALMSATKSGDRSAAIAPLIIDDQAIGTLTVINNVQSKIFTDYDLNLVIMLAGQAAIAIQNAQLYQAAQEADKLKSAFLASMSHELRTPLNSIIGFTGIILQGLAGPLNKEQQKQMGMVRDSARHLLSLINDVLDISKIEAGQLSIASEKVDMPTAINNVIRSVIPLAEKKNLLLLSNIAPDVGSIISDQRRVEQILINLINNAIKFTEKGTIQINSEIKDNWIVTSVQDTGIGIKKEDRYKLFQVFQQIETGLSRKHEGTGLGLSICKRLVELLGGEIWVDSEWGVGSTFTFTLPLEKQDET